MDVRARLLNVVDRAKANEKAGRSSDSGYVPGPTSPPVPGEAVTLKKCTEIRGCPGKWSLFFIFHFSDGRRVEPSTADEKLASNPESS